MKGVRAVHLVVDTGVDDALAIVAASLHPALALAQLTVSGGNVPRTSALANTHHVLDLLGAAGAVPVTLGAQARLDGRPFESRPVHGPDGLAGQRSPQGDAGRVDPPGAGAATGVREVTGLLVCTAPLTTLTGLAPGSVVATYGRDGQANHDLDPQASRQVTDTWEVTHADPAPPLTRHQVDLVWRRLQPTQVREPLTRFVRALLEHQVARGAGLGDADAVLRLAGGGDPLGDLVAALRR